jgi:predicted phage terminase large subunit-like protein
MQRLHEEDPTGFLLSKGGRWQHVMFPMRFEPDRADKHDPRTEPGQLLWPELFDEQKVRELELDLGPYGTAGQLQQRPAPEGGGLFKREWFKILDAVPHNIVREVRAWDTAGTEDGGDWTVGTRIGETSEGMVIIRNVVREQVGPAGVDALILQTAKMDGAAVPVREEKEGGSAGVAVIAARARTLRGFDYSGVPLTGDKVTRSKPLRAQAEAGNVFLVRGDWNEQFLSELSTFPAGAHDDQVDSAATGYNQMLLEPVKVMSLVW